MNMLFSNFKKIVLMLSALGVLLFTACQENEPKPEPEPEPEPLTPIITFNYEEVSVPQDGGSFAVEYQIENPVEGATLEISLGADWLVGLDTSIEGIVMFEALPNDLLEPRETVISLDYSALSEPVTLPVRQQAKDPDAIVFDNLQVGITSYSMDIIPIEKDIEYVFFTSNLSYMEDNGFMEDDERLFADDLSYFQGLADDSGMTLQEVLRYFTLKGDQIGYTIEGLGPKMDYVTYAYLINMETAERLSDIYRIAVSTTEPEQIEVAFEFEFADDQSIVDWTIDPGSYDGLYFWNAVLLHDFYLEYGQDASVEDFARTNWNNIVTLYQQMYGMTLEEILETYCASGRVTKRITTLIEEEEYAFYALAVDAESGYAASDATVENHTTGSVSASDMQLTFEIQELNDRSATIVCHPSTDEPYAATYVEKARFETYGANDQERFDYIFKWYMMSELRGEQTIHAEGLYPDTEYVVFGFGYQGGTNTTRIFTAEFTTASATYSDATMSVSWDACYDIPECYALDPDRFSNYYDFEGYAFLPMYITTTPEDGTFYYQAYILQEEDDYSDDMLISELIYYPQTEKFIIYALPYNYKILFAGMVEDENGEMGELCREEFVLTKDQTGDAQELIDLIIDVWGAPKQMPPKQMPRKQMQTPEQPVSERNHTKSLGDGDARGICVPESVAGKSACTMKIR